MSRYLARLVKLEAAVPAPPVVNETPRPQIDFKELCERISAETARVAALPPAERLAHILDEIEKVRRKAAAQIPSPDDSVRASLAVVMRKVLTTDVKKDFPFRQYEIRECEIQILREQGYDVAALDHAHREFAHIPWQWGHYQTPLPPAAQALIDLELFAL